MPKIIIQAIDDDVDIDVELTVMVRSPADEAHTLFLDAVCDQSDEERGPCATIKVEGEDIMLLLDSIVRKLPMDIIVSPSDAVAQFARMVLSNLEE